MLTIRFLGAWSTTDLLSVDMSECRFPPPWSIDEQSVSFVGSTTLADELM
jgi:hypothetical protein